MALASCLVVGRLPGGTAALRRTPRPPRRSASPRSRPTCSPTARSSPPTSAFALFFFLSVVAFSRVVEEATSPPRRSRPASPPAPPSPRSSPPRSCVPVLLLLGLARRPAPAPARRRSSPRWASLALARRLGLLRLPLRPLARPRRARGPARAARGAGRGPAAARGRGRGERRASCRRTTRAGSLFVMAHSEARRTFLLGRALGPRLPALLPRHVPAEDAGAPAAPHRPRRSPAIGAARSPRRRRSCGCRSSSTSRSPPRAACRSATATCCPSTRSSSSPRARRRRGSWSWRRPAGLALAAALGLWYAGGTLRQHPHHLAYFNEIAGGPANGWRLLVDSNLDWGQDLKRLAAWMRENGVAAGQALVLRQRRPVRTTGSTRETLPGYTAPHAPRVTREIRPGRRRGGERHEPAGGLPRARGPRAHGAAAGARAHRPGRLVDPRLPRRLRLAGAGLRRRRDRLGP